MDKGGRHEAPPQVVGQLAIDGSCGESHFFGGVTNGKLPCSGGWPHLPVCTGNTNWTQQVKNQAEDMKVGEFVLGDLRRLGEELGTDMIKIVYAYESFKIETTLKLHS